MDEITFSIKGFLGSKHLKVKLKESEPFIIVSENGSGKTTLLTMMAHVLLGSLGEEYRSYVSGKFSSINADFNINDKQLSSKISDSDSYNEMVSMIVKRSPRYFYSFLKRYLDYDILKADSSINDFISVFDTAPSSISRSYYENYLLSGKISREIVFDFYNYLSHKIPDRITGIEYELDLNNQIDISSFLAEQKIETIFLPVSRQLELKNRKSSDNSIYNQINIKSVLDQTTNQIRIKSSEANSKIFRNIFNYLSNDSSGGINMTNQDAVRILDERMASLINQKTSDNLKEMINSSKSQSGIIKKILFEINRQLEKDVYPLENKLKNFIKACNHFFENKQFIYDSNMINLDLKLNGSDQIIQPSELSSGELHIVTIFAKIFLLTSEDTRLIIIIDEPELSLSIDWQKKFVQTVLESNKIFSLVLSTHSPFIVGNENINGEYQYQNYLVTMSELVVAND